MSASSLASHLCSTAIAAMYELAGFFLWLQPAAATPVETTSGPEPAGSCALQSGAMLVGLAVFYFFMLRPDQKRREEAEALLKSLKKGMKVRTTGGILGEIVSLTDDEVVLAVADKVRINVLRSNIAGPEVDRAARAAAKEGKDAAQKEAKDDKVAPKDEARS